MRRRPRPDDAGAQGQRDRRAHPQAGGGRLVGDDGRRVPLGIDAKGNTLAKEEQWAKLRMIVETAEAVWG